MSQVSKAVRDGLKERLADAATGFNANLAAVASAYGVDTFAIDWSGDSANFLFGRVPPDLIESTSPVQYPALTIDTVRSQHDPRFKFALFAGPVQAIVEVHLSWAQSSALPDFASLADAVEDAIYAAMNTPAAVWPAGVLYGGEIACQRGPILAAGYNWRQTLQFNCGFRRITN